MTTITLPRAVAEQALEALEYAQQGRECPSTTRQAITALRAALAQQAEPVEPHRREGDNNIESPFNACMHKTYCMTLKQAEPLNLADPAVQKRLATQWGYVPAAQAEPVEPVATLIAQRDALLGALNDIANTDPVDAALDPQRAVRIARAAIRARTP